jgi:hypothetical protein
MQRIVDVHYPGLKKRAARRGAELFFELREVPGLKKKPSTSELLDWLKLLVARTSRPRRCAATTEEGDPAAVRRAAEERAGRAPVRAPRVPAPPRALSRARGRRGRGPAHPLLLRAARRRRPVSITEFLALLEALKRRVAAAQVEEFYYLARACAGEGRAHYDRFDRVFGEYFKGVRRRRGEGRSRAEVPAEWLRKLAERC